MSDLDLEARYRVDGYPGVAFYLRGFETRRVEVEIIDVDSDGNETYSYEWETEEDRSRVRAVMVGDDREHSVDVDELTALDELAYCAECGQIGCAHDGRERGDMRGSRPRPETVGRRKSERRRVRNALGPHSSDAPTMRACIHAARALDQLLMLTTAGRYRLVVTEPDAITLGARPHVPGWQELYDVAEGWRDS